MCHTLLHNITLLIGFLIQVGLFILIYINYPMLLFLCLLLCVWVFCEGLCFCCIAAALAVMLFAFAALLCASAALLLLRYIYAFMLILLFMHAYAALDLLHSYAVV